MENLGKDLEQALLYISDLYLYKNREISENYFDRIYHFTTEMIKGYFEKISFKNKDILTVMASGDHALNAILLGAKKVDTFDVNPLAVYYFKLKEAAIKSLSLEEFKSFFYSDYPNNVTVNDKMLNWKLYLKISPYLEEKYKLFWDNIYLEFSGLEIGHSDLFWQSDSSQNRLSVYNPYLIEKNYKILKNKLLTKKINVTFKQTNIKDIDLKNKYDYIFLSNISQYLNYMYENDYLENFNELVLKLSDNLNENGILFHSYLYDYTHYYNDITNQFMPKIYCNKEVEEKISNLDIMTFKSYGLSNDKDAVLIYKKLNNNR